MKNTVTQQQINELWNKATVIKTSVFNKCTIVACQLENGFIIVESSACVDPANYDSDMGYNICIERIKNKLWELEGYRLQNNLHEEKKAAAKRPQHANCRCTFTPMLDDETACKIEAVIKDRARTK